MANADQSCTSLLSNCVLLQLQLATSHQATVLSCLLPASAVLSANQLPDSTLCQLVIGSNRLADQSWWGHMPLICQEQAIWLALAKKPPAIKMGGIGGKMCLQLFWHFVAGASPMYSGQARMQQQQWWWCEANQLLPHLAAITSQTPKSTKKYHKSTNKYSGQAGVQQWQWWGKPVAV